MKCIAILIGLTLCVSYTTAQTFAEFFQQKKTQIKYLTEQITALQVYIGYVEKGYQITRDGMNVIGDLKNGEFSLHKDYFNSLTSISQAVKSDPRVQEAYALRQAIQNKARQCENHISESDLFSADEKSYLGSVWNNLLDGCASDATELEALTTGGNLQLQESERLDRIANVYLDLVDRYTFAQSFSADCKKIEIQKKKEMSEVLELESWNKK